MTSGRSVDPNLAETRTRDANHDAVSRVSARRTCRFSGHVQHGQQIADECQSCGLNAMTFEELADSVRRLTTGRHQGYLLRTVRRWCDWEDILQTSLLRAWNADPALLSLRCPRTARWLARIARNEMASAVRQHERQCSVQYSEAQNMRGVSSRGRSQNAEYLERQCRNVELAVSRLTMPQRQLIQMRCMHQLPWATMSSTIGCSERTLRRRYECAVSRLRRFLESPDQVAVRACTGSPPNLSRTIEALTSAQLRGDRAETPVDPPPSRDLGPEQPVASRPAVWMPRGRDATS